MALSTPATLLPATGSNSSDLTIGIVVSRFNWHITGSMLELAREELQKSGVVAEKIAVVYVPGSFELAMAAQAMLSHTHYDALICFGCVMKGETRHDVLVGDAAAQGIQKVALTTGVPIILGVICAENLDQAEARIVRGRECALAALEMAQTINMFKTSRQKVV